MTTYRKIEPQLIENLIELVRKKPQIYDSAMKEHRDLPMIANIWDDIAEVLNVESMDGRAWKIKWRTQRDAYVKNKRQMKKALIGQTYEMVNKRKFSDALSFLDPYLEESSSSTHGRSSETIGESDSLNMTEDNDEPVAASNPTTASKRRNNSLTDLEAALIDLYHAQKKPRKENVRDEIDCFMESCSLRMKKLPVATRALVQLQISQLLYNAENPYLPQQRIMSLAELTNMNGRIVGEAGVHVNKRGESATEKTVYVDHAEDSEGKSVVYVSQAGDSDSGEKGLIINSGGEYECAATVYLT